MPLINIDLGFSAFLQPGAAVDVINKILSFGPVGARGGGPQSRELDQLDQRQIAILKKKLRGAKVSVLICSQRAATCLPLCLSDSCTLLQIHGVCSTRSNISSTSPTVRARVCTRLSP